MTASIQFRLRPERQPGLLNGRHRFFLALLALFCLFGTSNGHAQDWRLSAGYSVEHFDLQHLAHPQFEGAPAYTQKGGVELELERYLLYRLYLALSANVLLHNQDVFQSS